MDRDLHQIYERYAGDVYRFLLKMCCDEELAKDLLQDTMLKAISAIDSFQGNCSVRTWLFSIGKNLYADYRKRADRRVLPLDSVPEMESADRLTDQLTDADTALHIHCLLHRLEEPYREVFSLRVFAELSFREIGAVFGKNGNWAGVTYYRAKQKLIELMKEEGLYDEN